MIKFFVLILLFSVNNIAANNLLLQSLNAAISEATKVLNLLSNTNNNNIHEKQMGTIQDCNELYQITLSSLNESLVQLTPAPYDPDNLADARDYLAAAATNADTCLEGLETAYGPLKQILVDTIIKANNHVTDSLSLLSSETRRTAKYEAGPPKWFYRKDGKKFISWSNRITVAADGSGNFTTITDAVNYAPNNSARKVVIYIKRGLYKENVVIPKNKPNIVLLGEGRDVTLISGNRSTVDGWTPFRSATVGVSGPRFVARDIGFYNTAGPTKHQAVALRISANLVAFYRCTISGYQDTLYVHSFKQFFRECNIFGTIDYIFGNAAVVFQKCNIVSKLPMPNQFIVITAQSRNSSEHHTGIAFKNCRILATKDLNNSTSVVKSYLGRPWRPYARAVIIESYIDNFIDPKGWIPWSGDQDQGQGLDKLYYGEYENFGPGSSLQGRVTWPGHHIMDYHQACKFNVSKFINARKWLKSTSIPYDD
ncbi:probable pectinesterase/pectinesterase inhibitor 12 [Rutidosis leptorrhynchoides]|uniref:probable pectinesterase/pectinesterase inhibitor 12 n=1 Tax=Rutidosis leptorrhynchoides TaxID=125765 RepID=UPI003A992BA3